MIFQAGVKDGYINEKKIFIISGRFRSNILNYWKSANIIRFFFR
jgi:hypothetical protein